jgi:hypothetical protein
MSADRISAAELRAMGINIDASIPDCATTSRSGMTCSVVSSFMDGDTLQANLSVTISEPLTWVEVTVLVEKCQPPSTL